MNGSDHPPIEINGPLLYSARFDDHYASRIRPQEEKFFVFCHGNGLLERFSTAQRFAIGELGFGSGLGFLVTAKLWLDTAPVDATLEFYSIEGYPLSREQLVAAQTAYPELADFARELQQAYPGDNTGFHRLNLFDERIRLTLMFCDVQDALAQMEARVDAWYLDGFAPKKNPDMWQPVIFQAMNRLSRDGATFATYTSAGQVRRDLKAAGFEAKRAPSPGPKRERLVGKLDHRLRHLPLQKPWRQRPHGAPDLAEITVLGGGIAGCALANRLAARGVLVTIVEAEHHLAGGASSNPVAISHPHFTRDQNLTSQLALQGFLYTRQTIDRLQARGLDTGFHATGMVVLPKSDKDCARQREIVTGNPPVESLARWSDTRELSQQAGLPVQHEGWFLQQGGWVSLPLLCHALVKEYASRITLVTGMEVADIRNEEGHWQLLSADGEVLQRCEKLVLANGYAMKRFKPVSHLPLRANRGQVNYARAADHGVTPVLCAKGYTVPLDSDHLCFGSSYAPGDAEPRIDSKDHTANIQQLARAFPELAAKLDDTDSLDWSGVRTVLPDRFPLLGEVARPDAFVATFGPMFRGEVQHRDDSLPVYPGLYVLTGLGSRSVAYGMISAEALAAGLMAQPSPLPRRLRDALDVNRFLLRKNAG